MSCTDTSATNLTNKAGRSSQQQGRNSASSTETWSRGSDENATGKAQHLGPVLQWALGWTRAGSTLSSHTHRANCSKNMDSRTRDHYPPLLSTGETISGLEVPLFRPSHSTLLQFHDPFLWPKVPITEIQHWHRAQQTEPEAQQRDRGQPPNVEKGEGKKKKKAQELKTLF